MTEYLAWHDIFVRLTDSDVSYIKSAVTPSTVNKGIIILARLLLCISCSRAGVFYLLHDKRHTRGNAGTQSQCPYLLKTGVERLPKGVGLYLKALGSQIPLAHHLQPQQVFPHFRFNSKLTVNIDCRF